MWYRILADIVVAIHFAYVGYVVFGFLLILVGIPLRWQWIRNFWFRVTHLLMMLIVALEAVVGFECPLTTWEYDLLKAARSENELIGASAPVLEHHSFVGRLLHELTFFECPNDAWFWPWIYCGVAGLILLTFVLAPPRWPAILNGRVSSGESPI